MNPEAEGAQAYVDALERADRLKAKWRELDYPMLEEGSRGQAVPHPLLKAINEAEVIADRPRQHVLKKHRGPEPVAVTTAKLGKSPAARLREVAPSSSVASVATTPNRQRSVR